MEGKWESLILLLCESSSARVCVCQCVCEEAERKAEKVCRCTKMCHSPMKSFSKGGQENYGSVKIYTTFTQLEHFSQLPSRT